MKKLILLLLFIPLFSFSQINDIDYDEELLVYDDGNEFVSTKVYYLSKPQVLIFRTDKQSVYINIERVKEFGELYKKGVDKAIEWAEVARENKVMDVEKKMDWNFKTDGGMVYDASTFKTVEPNEGEFLVNIQLTKRKTFINYRYRVLLSDEYNVYTSFANVGLVIIGDKKGEGLKQANQFIDFCLNYENYVNQAIDKFNSKDSLFK